MASQHKGKGKGRADPQPEDSHIQDDAKGKTKTDDQPGFDDEQMRTATDASRRTYDEAQRGGHSQGSSSRSAAGALPHSTQSHAPTLDNLSQSMGNVSVAGTGKPNTAVPVTLPTNTGSMAGSGSTTQGNTHSGVPEVQIRDAAEIDWRTPTNYVNPPSSTRRVASRSETVYPPAHDFGTIINALPTLKEGSGKLNYPVRASVRPKDKRNPDESVVTNHFEVAVDENTAFYEYQIVITPDTVKRNTRKRLIATAIEDVDFLSQRKASFASDYLDTIISWVPLHDFAPGPKVQSHDATYPNSYDEWRLIDVVDRDVTIKLNLRRRKRVIDLAEFRSFTNGTHNHPDTFDPEPTRKALHIVMTKCIRDQDVFHLNANKFFVKSAFRDLKASQDRIDTLRAIRGYHYKITTGMGKILLNVSYVTSAFWNINFVSDVLIGGLGIFDGSRSSLKGLKVHIEYERGKSGRDANAVANGKTEKAVGNGKTDKVVGDDDQSNDDGENTVARSIINDQHSRIKRIRRFGLAANVQEFEWTPRDNNGNPGPAQNIKVSDYLLQGESSTKYALSTY